MYLVQKEIIIQISGRRGGHIHVYERGELGGGTARK